MDLNRKWSHQLQTSGAIWEDPHLVYPESKTVRLFQPALRKFVQPLLMVCTGRLTVDELNSCPHHPGAMFFSLRGDTPCTYISSIAVTGGFPLG
jgi:hypothetical protein